jgi:hypothetical protein
MATSKAPQIVLQIDKVKSVQALHKMARHWDRSDAPRNADPALIARNQQLVGSDPAADVSAMLPEKRRKDAVLAMSMILSASPQYFRPDEPARSGHYDQRRVDAYVEATMGWAKKEFGKRLVSAVLHLDETTPHIHLAVVPLGPKGTLNAKDMFNKPNLIRFQDEVAQAVSHLGIKRGTRGSTATHEEIKEHYRAVHESNAPIDLAAADRAALVAGRTPQKVKDLQAKAADQDKSLQQAEEARREAARQSVEADAAKQALRATQDRLRGIPIAEVLPLLGYERDPNDKVEGWKGPAGRLTQGVRAGTPEKFMLHDMGEGGGGAIDLVMKIDNRSFKDAVTWLASQFGSEKAVATHTAEAEANAKAALASAKPVTLLKFTEKPEHLKAVSDYLSETRKIHSGITKSLMENNFIGAAQSGRFINAAFPLMPAESVGSVATKVGTLLRGTQPDHDFHGVRGQKAIWGYRTSAHAGGKREVMLIAESPVNAMSIHTLHLAKTGLLGSFEKDDISHIFYTATVGSSRDQLKGLVKSAVSKGMQIYTAFDDDKTGRTLHATVAETAKDASPNSVVTNMSGLLVMAGQNLNDFNQLLLLFLKEGAAILKERVAAAQQARKERLNAETAARGARALRGPGGIGS